MSPMSRIFPCGTVGENPVKPRGRKRSQNRRLNFMFSQRSLPGTVVQIFHFAFGAQNFQDVKKTWGPVRVVASTEGQNEPLPGWMA